MIPLAIEHILDFSSLSLYLSLICVPYFISILRHHHLCGTRAVCKFWGILNGIGTVTAGWGFGIIRDMKLVRISLDISLCYQSIYLEVYLSRGTFQYVNILRYTKTKKT